MSIKRRTALASVAAAALAGNAWAQKAPAKKIVLGQSVPLTGAADQSGLAYAAGAKLYFDAFNSRKPAPPYQFELKQLDGGYDPKKAGANAQKLLAEGAEVLFGI